MSGVAAWREKLQGRRLAILSPYSNRRRKDWPLERFGQLSSWLVEEHGMSCLIVGSKKNGEGFASVFPFDGERILNGADGLSFSEVLELLPSAALMVGNDSALGHYAGLFGVPALVLFSAAHSFSAWGPQSGRFIALQAQVPCRLCSFRIEGCDHDYLCMRELTVEMAKQACRELLVDAVR